MTPRTRSRRCRGLALIVVLWTVALMTLLAAGFSFSLRTEARLAMGVGERARAAAAAEAGVRRLLASMAATGPRDLRAVRTRIVYEGIAVELSAVPENSRIDLNAAPEPLLRGLLARAAERLGEPIDVDALTDAILDWRDGDSTARPQGAEDRDYRAAGLGARPRDAPFLSMAELAQVMGVTARLYEKLGPMVTVYAWSPQVDPNTASRDVLLALPGMPAATVDAFLQAREADPGGTAPVALLNAAGPGIARYLSRGRSVVFGVTARARTESGVRAVRRAVVKFNANAKQPISVLAWFRDAHPGESGEANGG